jgi:hypothetical protein
MNTKKSIWLAASLLFVLIAYILSPYNLYFAVPAACAVLWMVFTGQRAEMKLGAKSKSPFFNTTVAVLLGLPGAWVVGALGCLAAAFSGDASPSAFGRDCWFFWGGVGGACVGAIPGLIFGLLRGLRWTIPLLGAAAGALLGVPMSFSVFDINTGGIVHAGLVLFGFLAGIVLIAMSRTTKLTPAARPDNLPAP